MKILLMENHSSLLKYWQKENKKGLFLVHIDTHCDMRGLLVDPLKRRAWNVAFRRGVDDGNFLTYAVELNIITQVQWIYGPEGGRENDFGTVIFLDDLKRFPFNLYRYKLKGEGTSVQFKMDNFTSWVPPSDSFYLDIDWDFFAPRGCTAESTQQKIDWFFRVMKGLRVQEIYLALSPSFSAKSEEAYNGFLSQLKDFFQCEVLKIEEKPNVKIPECIIDLRHKIKGWAVLLKKLFFRV